ncbi:MAG TPA: flagellar motor switch protein FliN [Oceanospirillales bacterium]|jgi:flagellar motor switch protein FliN/FliY|nr:flagellar motor switch protein FliN [Oleispira sp.]HCM05907.1 flagellar motor switch protein FliN [Oceanospirillales bacterium]|tara:strand:+ start:14001 stop:14606 length:606 start_codon:yes stop_codon:yes gene_type:complete
MSDDSQDENEKESGAEQNPDLPESTDTDAGEDSGKIGDIDIDSLADDVASGVEEAADSDAAVGDEWAAALAEDPTAEEAGNVGDEWADAMSEETDSVKQAPLDELTDEGKPNGDLSPELDVILDIPVAISMEVGRTEIPIRNLLQLNQGSVVELDRLAGEPLDVLVNGTLIAHGEVVMVNDKFGIRLTDVVSQSERIQRLR